MSNTAVLDENGIATVAGDITVYHYDTANRLVIHLILKEQYPFWPESTRPSVADLPVSLSVDGTPR
ncbi:hypothetical protein [Escherichia coli]|uniref:hypothetical protein n=1 Tax=Escherichia coli TaxID=562 RepID=UPI0038905615